LIARIRLRFDEHLDSVAIPERGVVLLRGGDIRFLAAAFIATHRDGEIPAHPEGFRRGSEGRRATSLQLA